MMERGLSHCALQLKKGPSLSSGRRTLTKNGERVECAPQATPVDELFLCAIDVSSMWPALARRDIYI